MVLYTLLTSITRMVHYNGTYLSILTQFYTHTVHFCYGKTLVTQKCLFGNAPLVDFRTDEMTEVTIMAWTRKSYSICLLGRQLKRIKTAEYIILGHTLVSRSLYTCFNRFPIDNDVIILIIYNVSKTTTTTTTFAYAAC